MAMKGFEWDPTTGQGRVRKVIGGRRIQTRFQASSRDEAEAVFYRVIAQGNIPKSESRTFMSAATHYLNTEQKKSLDRDSECLDRVMPFIGKLPLDKIHQGSLDGYLLKRKADGVRSGTVGRELAVVRRVMTLAARFWRDADGVPWLKGEPPLFRLPDWNDKRQPYALDADEQKRLLSHLPDHLRDMTIFALNTGMRQNNVCYLRWEWERRIKQLNNRSLFVIPAAFMKNKHDALIPINETAQAVIDRLRPHVKDGEKHPEYVFTFEGKPIARINNNGWRTAWKKSGLPSESEIMSGPHNLRHTFARQLKASGVSQDSIKALLSHVDGDVTARYAPAEIKNLLTIVDNLQEQEFIIRI